MSDLHIKPASPNVNAWARMEENYLINMITAGDVDPTAEECLKYNIK